MREVSYCVPAELGEAVKLLAEQGDRVTILAGGTDILPKLNHYEIKPEMIMYLGNLGLDYIREADGKIVIGAAVTTSALVESELVEEKASALAEAARQSGSVAIRNSATIGGNIVNASPAADLVVALLALGASVRLVGAGGDRTVELGEFILGPNQTALKPGEILTEVLVPYSKGKTVFLKVGRRKAQTLSVVNVAIQLAHDKQECKDARIVLGAMAPTPVRCTGAEDLIRSCALPLATGHFGQGGHGGSGKKLDETTMAQCAARAVDECSPIDDIRASAWYRRQAGQALVVRALKMASEI